MNNVAISPNIFMYALQNQNVERKTVRQIDIKSLQKTNHYNNDTTDINELTNSDETVNDEVIDNNIEIPDILIPQSEPEPMPQTELDKDFAPLNM
jgi:hypothetical protein